MKQQWIYVNEVPVWRTCLDMEVKVSIGDACAMEFEAKVSICGACTMNLNWHWSEIQKMRCLCSGVGANVSICVACAAWCETSSAVSSGWDHGAPWAHNSLISFSIYLIRIGMQRIIAIIFSHITNEFSIGIGIIQVKHLRHVCPHNFDHMLQLPIYGGRVYLVHELSLGNWQGNPRPFSRSMDGICNDVVTLLEIPGVRSNLYCHSYLGKFKTTDYIYKPENSMPATGGCTWTK